MQKFLDSLSPAYCECVSPSAKHLQASAKLLAPLLKGGDFIGLVGELGAGKTTWCSGLGQGLNAATALRSPSYLLMHEIDADIPILHLDAYFEHRLDSLLGEGECERFTSDNIVLVEWANHASHWWPKNGLYIGLSHNSESGRNVSIHGIGSRGKQLAEAYAESLISFVFHEPGA
jgi:tRNA threonylcarbamoyladenosine biosynthesis protein TsaE